MLVDVAVSLTSAGNVAAAEIESVAVDVSTTGALNVLVTTVSASVAVAVSEIVEENVCLPDTESVAVEVSATNDRYVGVALRESVAVDVSLTAVANV